MVGMTRANFFVYAALSINERTGFLQEHQKERKPAGLSAHGDVDVYFLSEYPVSVQNNTSL